MHGRPLSILLHPIGLITLDHWISHPLYICPVTISQFRDTNIRIKHDYMLFELPADWLREKQNFP